ncbi:MAG: ExsB family protein [Deltaproteobacteria bacterium RIFCSPLOWO2_01_44_7]|nr:MAG: ExsB family protein [Deltaproteobacteria bacterium RIFCSPHIGHO2_01_FULL_43_49]OGQ15068.1 MAG: ExsB family protein [Deltaproteobacteria bacterium RIFCSPHIGHO2_02_FULL_44_53]OGQ27312.1 MAG: ExsB family protein [Deltaproteobacteria bacterium RIFCSPHIGHO2_12_FULL_44_21]OGQ31585.1 MAG: ExsB family protein [Deltaproteobacteria bacterium RIFCSPLOWO2_01_FULL_45_74]OGQ38192.1 MAG: ExsB family protein [Deltaproteobacteria bacterium RIFCSPLOWO2_01_44_7]OGQ42786.1 MAG: ExsB family protein [Deltapr
MDSTDPEIQFDNQGRCNHCRRAKATFLKEPFCLTPGEKRKRLDKLVEEIKWTGRKKPYDCIIGVSGGVDSTYVAYMVKVMGLRPLAVHLDNGWNSRLAVTNIEITLKKLGIDLYTHVIDWEEFRDLQLSFLKASTPDSEIPSDHAIFTLLYQSAAREGLRYVVTGMNHSTESIMPQSWSHGHWDWKYINNVHRKFGTVPFKTFPYMTYLQRLYYESILKIRWISLLDYLDYKKENAINILEQKLGWTCYGGKHRESVYTRFYQTYILPKKFGYDKRKGHLSSLIVSGQITREHALEELNKLPCDPASLREEKEYVLNKLDLTDSQFDEILAKPPKKFADYSSYETNPFYRMLNRGTWLTFGEES